MYGKRESECASSRKRVEREGGTRKSVSASLLTAPGLRDSSSLRFPHCGFNSIPSVQLLLLLFFVLIICAASERFSSGIALTFFCTAGTINLFIKTFLGITRRAFLQRTLIKLQFHPGRGLSSVWLLWIRQTVGVKPLTTLKVSKD